MDNRQVSGYMLLACKEIGLSKVEARDLYGAMYEQFVLKTDDEAEQLGFDWYYSEEDE